MRSFPFRILNVFTCSPTSGKSPKEVQFSGNPLAVVEDGTGLTDAELSAIARQFNLSETTFVFPPQAPGATARVRIFTPNYEMPFAGHPTLGTAHVVRDMARCGNDVRLEMICGVVNVTADASLWTLQIARDPVVRVPQHADHELAEMLGIGKDSVAGDPLWVDTGVEQLIIPLRSEADIDAVRPRAELLAVRGKSPTRGVCMAYVFARTAPGQVVARFFFDSNGAVVEDPATGSACANLGGYLLHTKAALPLAWSVSQGDQMARPSRLSLRVDTHGTIFVGGHVVELGRGQLNLK